MIIYKINKQKCTCRAAPRPPCLHNHGTPHSPAGCWDPSEPPGPPPHWPAQIWSTCGGAGKGQGTSTVKEAYNLNKDNCDHNWSKEGISLTGLSLKPNPRKSKVMTRWKRWVSASQICREKMKSFWLVYRAAVFLAFWSMKIFITYLVPVIAGGGKAMKQNDDIRTSQSTMGI